VRPASRQCPVNTNIVNWARGIFAAKNSAFLFTDTTSSAAPATIATGMSIRARLSGRKRLLGQAPLRTRRAREDRDKNAPLQWPRGTPGRFSPWLRPAQQDREIPWYVWQDEHCAAWPAIAADRYTGPWNQPTANPILLINNIADPATPYQNAVFMAHTLANARLLTGAIDRSI
jgi:hypothetical protein